jgi:hypothetical protein
MVDADQLLTRFKRGESCWSGKVPFRFWGGEILSTDIELAFDGKPSPTDYQLRTFRSMVEYNDDIRPYFATELFNHYQRNIFRAMTHWSNEKGCFGAEEITPPVRSASEIWRLIDGPDVYIRPDYQYIKSIQFRLAFDCHWDPEHGLGAQFQDWKIVDFGGSAE